jgi:zinc protease
MSILTDLRVKHFEGTLKNGIRVLLLQRKGAPIATSAILNSGSQYDPAHAHGMAHFIEHMITNGSEKFPSKDVLAEHIESVGGGFGARTNQEYLIIDTEVSEKEDYERVVDIFDAMLCHPLMDKAVFENEKNIVIKEIQKSLSNPGQLEIKVGRELFFKNTELEHPVLGNEATVRSIAYEDMLDSHNKLFDASRLLFVVAGDITLEEVITQLNTLHYKEGVTFEEITIQRNSFPLEKSITAFFDTTQTHFIFGVPAPVSNTKDMIHLQLLGAIVAGGRSSRLTKRLRYNKGLVYDVGVNRIGITQIGQWGIFSNTSEDTMQEVIDEIILEIKDLQHNGVKENELAFVKNRRIKSVKRYAQTSKDWVELYLYPESYKAHSMDFDAFLEEIKTTTVDDIKHIIDTYFRAEKWQLAMVGRTEKDSINFNW